MRQDLPASGALVFTVKTLLALSCMLDFSGSLLADEPRPRIGLVRGGGGARGGAHVGVLKVLDEMRIPFDCIAGTSMGALVGGGYASGMSAGEIEAFLRTVDWQSVGGGVGNRALQSAEQKAFDDATGSVEVG